MGVSEQPPASLNGRQAGSQTLARGLTALLAVAGSVDDLSVADVAASLKVHRSIAYRLLQTLAEFGLVARTPDGLYRAGARLAALSDSYLSHLRHAAVPIIRPLADELGSTVSLFVAEGREAVAIEMVEPTTVSHHLSFRPGMRTPIDRGAAGYALLTRAPPGPDDPPGVKAARRHGFATSHGEIYPGAHAVAAAIPGARPAACINLITYYPELAASSVQRIADAAREIGESVRLISRQSPVERAVAPQRPATP